MEKIDNEGPVMGSVPTGTQRSGPSAGDQRLGQVMMSSLGSSQIHDRPNPCSNESASARITVLRARSVWRIAKTARPLGSLARTGSSPDSTDPSGCARSGNARSLIITASDRLRPTQIWWRQDSRSTRLIMFLSGAAGAKRLDTDRTNSLRSGFGSD